MFYERYFFKFIFTAKSGSKFATHAALKIESVAQCGPLWEG